MSKKDRVAATKRRDMQHIAKIAAGEVDIDMKRAERAMRSGSPERRVLERHGITGREIARITGVDARKVGARIVEVVDMIDLFKGGAVPFVDAEIFGLQVRVGNVPSESL